MTEEDNSINDLINGSNSEEEIGISEAKEDKIKPLETAQKQLSDSEVISNVPVDQPVELKISQDFIPTKPKNKLWDFFLIVLTFFGGLILDILIVLAIVVFVRVFIVSPFQVKGHSMDSTFSDGDFIIVDQISQKLSNLEKGDVIVFRPPSNGLYYQQGILCEINKIKAKVFRLNPEKACWVPEFYVKRIIGVPGDTVEIKGGKVYVAPNSSAEKIELNEPYLNSSNKDRTYASAGSEEKNYLVPDNSYFVLGDNRNGSNDSRHWRKNGEEDPFVPFASVRGQVRIILWPIADFKFVKNINPIPE